MGAGRGLRRAGRGLALRVERVSMLTIHTDRLVLRRWLERDRAPFAAMNADPGDRAPCRDGGTRANSHRDARPTVQGNGVRRAAERGRRARSRA
jgi:hypothetical protein